jgi:uncharacterized membrane protein HdeD (DUF308 family)
MTAATSSEPTATPGEVDARLADRWRWFIALGVTLLVLGGLGLLMVGPLSLASTLTIGVLFLVGGVVQALHAFRFQGWRSTASHAAGAVLYVVAGLLLLAQPLFGLVTITLFLGAIILAAGVMRIVIGFQHRGEQGWTWLLLSGVVGVLLGLLILSGLPGNAIWVLGLFVALELLMAGWSMVMMGVALRRWKRAEAA